MATASEPTAQKSGGDLPGHLFVRQASGLVRGFWAPFKGVFLHKSLVKRVDIAGVALCLAERYWYQCHQLLFVSLASC